MLAGREMPRAVVLCIGLNHGEVGCDVEAPCCGPPFELGLQFRPLFLDATNVSTLVVEEQGCGLDEALHKQNFVLAG